MDENTAAASRADDNVVSASGKVVNALNQAATSRRLKWFSEKVEQLFFVVATQSKLRPILQKY